MLLEKDSISKGNMVISELKGAGRALAILALSSMLKVKLIGTSCSVGWGNSIVMMSASAVVRNGVEK